MKIFDENWNFLGEFIEDSKDKKVIPLMIQLIMDASLFYI